MMNQYFNINELPIGKFHQTIFGISAVIGTIGGIYLLTQSTKYVIKIVEKRPKRKCIESCSVCSHNLDTDNDKNYVDCSTCHKLICRDENCCVQLSNDSTWECQLCHSKRQEIIEKEILEETELLNDTENDDRFTRPMLSRSELYIPIIEYSQSSSLSNYDSRRASTSALSFDQKIQIRDYVEDILSSMLGGSLDSVAVSQLSKSERYLPLTPNNNELIGVSQTKLKQLIEKIVGETLQLPAIEQNNVKTTESTKQNDENDESLLYFEPQKYQELLATAVLNKIVDAKSNGKIFENGTESSISRGFDKNHNSLKLNQEENSSSGSSIEPRSDSSLTNSVFKINKGEKLSPTGSYSNIYDELQPRRSTLSRESVLSDYLAAHKIPLPELSSESESLEEEEEEEEDFDSLPSNEADGSWEDNWLFKKTKLGQESTSIGMLVPAPKDDFRALIGDKTADEISDFSEAGSDMDEISMETIDASIDPPNDRLRNKHLIGGKNAVGLFDELIDQTSMISSSSLQDNETMYAETKNEHVVGNEGLNEDSKSLLTSLTSFAIPIKNEAVNSTLTTEVLQNSPPKRLNSNNTSIEGFDDPILPPPIDFDDEFAKIYEEYEQEELSNQNSAIISKPSDETGADRISSDSNTTDESTETVIDTYESSSAGSLQEVDSCCSLSTEDIVIPTNKILTNPEPFTISNGLAAEENVNGQLNQFIPGSVAEREHQKWKNAVEMPNNPYAPEALKRRISGSQEKFIDLPNISPSTENAMGSLESTENMEEQIRDYARYSRDYYINDSKHACGIKKKNQLEINSSKLSNDDYQPQEVSVSDELTEHNASVQISNADIFAARPIIIDDHETIIDKQTQDFDLLSTEEIIKLQNSSNLDVSLQPNNDSSLSLSEDSDTMRVYNLNKQETTIIRDNTKQQPKRPTTLSITNGQKSLPGSATLSSSSPIYTPNKSSTPSSFKFLQPKRKLIDPSQIIPTDLDSPVKTPNSEKKVIEEDVINALPSVKALAQVFLLTSAKCSSIHNENRSKKFKMLSPITPPKPMTSPIITDSYPLTPTSSPNIEEKSLMSHEDDIISTIVNSNNLSSHMTIPERPLSPNLVSGVLKNNIAFFENLKNTQ